MMGRPKGQFKDEKEGWEVYDTHEDSFGSIGMDRHDLVGFVVSEANENEAMREMVQALLAVSKSVADELESMLNKKAAPKEVLAEMLKYIKYEVSKIIEWDELEGAD